MKLYGWKYKGRIISEKLHKQFLEIINYLDDPTFIAHQDWPTVQKLIAKKLDVAPGQIRTIKRLLEEFCILKEGSLNGNKVPDETIYTTEGYENEIAKLKAYNEKLLDGDIEKHNKIVEMGKENSRLKQIILGNEMEIAAKDETIEDLFETNQRLKIELDTPVYDKLDKAKELIKRLIKETYGEGWNYSLQVKVEAEKFLKELEQ